MGFVSKKRGRLGLAILRGQKASIMHEFYYILFQLIMVVLVLAALIAYVNNVATDLGFEKRFTSIDMALLTDVIYYAPGTLKHIYTPIAGGEQLLIKSPVDAGFINGTIRITQRDQDLPPTMFWYLSDRNMDRFQSSVALQGNPEDSTIDGHYIPPNITYYKSGRNIAFDDVQTNALHLVCPTINTSDPDWVSKKVFVAKMLPRQADYANQSLAVNRIAQILSARHANFQVSGSEGSGTQSTPTVGSAQISAIPDDADIIIALGDSGREREPGALVTFVPADDDLLRSRKLACLVTNDLLSPETTVYYTQVMPVYPDTLEADSPLSVFKERSLDNQTMIFIDISNFGEDQISVDNVARGIYIGIQRYYGDEELAPLYGATFNFTITGDVLAALAAFGVSVPGVSGGAGVSGGTANSLQGSGDSPARRMFSVCTPRAEALEGPAALERLKDVTNFWQEQSFADGAVYVRGGQTNRAALTCSNHGQASWILDKFTKWFPSFSPPSSCTPSSRSADCMSEMRSTYQSMVVDNLAGHYVCGDCGTYLVQMYNCAFGRTEWGVTHPITAPIIASTPGTQVGQDSNGGWAPRDRMVNGDRTYGNPTGTCWEEVIQGQLGGQLQFGDVIQLPGHYVMYTGGAGLDYEILEMGGWRFPPEAGIRRGANNIQYGGHQLTGIRTVNDAQIALSGNRLRQGCVVHRVGAPTPETTA